MKIQYNATVSGFEGIGKILIGVGVFLVLFGLIFVFWPRIPILGKLPGDILVQKDGWTFFFPLVTSLLLSLILTIILNLVLRLFSKLAGAWFKSLLRPYLKHRKRV